jgi:hypothetical protein
MNQRRGNFLLMTEVNVNPIYRRETLSKLLVGDTGPKQDQRTALELAYQRARLVEELLSEHWPEGEDLC